MVLNVIKGLVLPVSSIHQSMTKKEGYTDDDQSGGGGNFFTYAVDLALLAIAGYLCWTCNVGEEMWKRVVFTILSVLFSTIYLAYYVIYHVLMGNKCTVA